MQERRRPPTLAPPSVHNPQRPGRNRVRLAAAGALLACVLVASPAAFGNPATGQPPKPQSQPVYLPSDPSLSPGIPLVTLPWGNGPGQVGVEQPGEGLARGPEALAVAPDGRLAILDTVNHRLLLLSSEGADSATIPLTAQEPRFLAATDQALYVLDAGPDPRLDVFTWQGVALARHALPAFEEPPTGLFVTGRRAFVELLHDRVYEVRPGSGEKPAQLVAARGRPIDQAGRLQAQATFVRGASPRIVAMDAGQPATAWDRELLFPQVLEHLVSLDADAKGRPVLGARLLAGEEADEGPDVLVVRLPSSETEEAQALLLEEGPGVIYTGQPYVLGPDGRVYQPVADAQGYRVLAHDFPEGRSR